MQDIRGLENESFRCGSKHGIATIEYRQRSLTRTNYAHSKQRQAWISAKNEKYGLRNIARSWFLHSSLKEALLSTVATKQ